MPPLLTNDVYFLGGRDLEMVTIRRLLDRVAPGQVRDRSLAWGARASDYRDEIAAALATDQTIVLVELQDDLQLTTGPEAQRICVIDHHGPLAGAQRPTALEQVFARLERPASEWTRWDALVAANDRGHIAAMQALGATEIEIRQVRAADRAAQGISLDEEASGQIACAQAETAFGGRLTVVHLPHARTATVTDALDPALGGPGYQNLLILSPAATHFFGEGRFIKRLAETYPGSYFGGELPQRGFWGCARRLDFGDLLALGIVDHE